jgi:predicted dehydrogenase
MDTIRIGIIGLGGIFRQRHMPGLFAVDDVEVVAVCNRSRESSEAAAKEFNIPDVEDSWQALIARDDLDAIFIGTWPYMHKELSIAALDSGKHVFCQARMAMNYEEAQAMYAKSETAGKVAMLCPVPFGMSVDKTIIRLQKEGTLGEVRLVRVQSFSDMFADSEAKVNWRKDHRLSGLNMATLGMYIEVMHRWFGWTKDVSAQINIFTPTRLEETGEDLTIEVPDQILAHTTMENETPIEYTVNTAVHNGAERIEIYGSNMTLQYDVFKNTLFEVGKKGALTEVDIRPEEAYNISPWTVETEFINAIREGADYYPDFHDGLKYMQVVQAMYDSAAISKKITL